MKKFFCSLLVLALCFALLPVSALALGDGDTLSGTVEGNQIMAVLDGETYTITLDNATVKGALVFDNPSSGSGMVTIKVKGNCVIEGGDVYLSSHGGEKNVGMSFYKAGGIIHLEDGASLTIRGKDLAINGTSLGIINLWKKIGTVEDQEYILLAPGAVLPGSATPIPEEAPIPETGDGMGLFVFAGLALLSVAGMVVMKKREQF